ncbi:hypothetical protein L798_08947 [Zootermopsis nevadensis]|uniref:Uncharacterized protein n=1 Tax=Zootermopsis nevadensis TaxID=136037 RepID=A0A067QPG6_ZOONE|nr:hypothetical protein L798_08947 [Zootermopsis nevadensis]
MGKVPVYTEVVLGLASGNVKMEAVCTFEMVVTTYKTTRCSPEDHHQISN